MHVDIMSKLYALSRGILHFVFAGGASWNDNIIKVHRAVPSLKGYHDLAGTKDLVRAHLTLMQHQQRVFNPACLSSSLDLCRPSCGLWGSCSQSRPQPEEGVRLGRGLWLRVAHRL
jgi:hypothetical protein